MAGAPAAKAGRLVSGAEPVEVAASPPRFVSRGGEKLDGALARLAVDVAGRSALDAGASTGGFTDCLLQRGAARVVAVDVGRGQFHERLRHDSRVRLLERTNLRHLSPSDVEGPLDVVTADLSFISLRTVAPAVTGVVGPDGDLVLLVKPQFEAGRAAAARGRGVVRDPALWREALEHVRTTYSELGAAMMGAMVSPLLGPAGNAEFFLHLTMRPAADRAVAPALDLDAALDEAATMVAAAKGKD